MRQLLKLHFDMEIRTACNAGFCFVFPVPFLVMPNVLLAFLSASILWLKDFRELLVVTPGSRVVCWFRVQHHIGKLQIIFSFSLQPCTCLPWSSSAIRCSHTQLREVFTIVTASVYLEKLSIVSRLGDLTVHLFFCRMVNKINQSQHWCLEGPRTDSSLPWKGSIKLFLCFPSLNQLFNLWKYPQSHGSSVSICAGFGWDRVNFLRSS